MAKQLRIAGTERPVYDEIDDAAEDWLDKRDKRDRKNRAKTKEEDAKAEVLRLMSEAGVTEYVSEKLGKVIIAEDPSTKLKSREHKGEDAEKPKGRATEKDDRSLADLRAHCKKEGISIPANASRTTILAAIEAAE